MPLATELDLEKVKGEKCLGVNESRVMGALNGHATHRT
jgi:hypothetical protein